MGLIKKILKWGAISFTGFIALLIVIGLIFGDEESTVAAPGPAAETAAAADASDAEAKAKEAAEAVAEREARAEAERRAQAEAEEKAEAERKAQAVAEAKAAAAAEKKAKAAAEKKARAAAKRQSVTVTNVVDGDTVDLSNGERVRVIGIDTPERGECGFTVATQQMESLVLGKQVTVVAGARDDRDRYDRILRYLDVGKTDAGLALIKKGYANARYDSRDGYGAHPREDRYVSADAATADNFTCNEPAPKPAPAPAPAPSNGGGSVYYKNCTAARDAGAAPVYRGDPGYASHLDGDGDGVGCE